MTDTNKINLLKDLEKLENLDKIKTPAEKAYEVNYGDIRLLMKMLVNMINSHGMLFIKDL
jgi:hypothetical protein